MKGEVRQEIIKKHLDAFKYIGESRVSLERLDSSFSVSAESSPTRSPSQTSS